MADNFQVNAIATSGDIFAADDIANVKHTRVKVETGPDGSATDVSLSNPMPVGTIPLISGGLLTHKTISVASTNATSVTTVPAQIYNLFVSNTNAAARYCKLYNKTSSPTVGTDIPVSTLLIPGNTAGAGFSAQFSLGWEFTSGIAFSLGTEIQDSGISGVSANEHVVNIFYKK